MMKYFATILFLISLNSPAQVRTGGGPDDKKPTDLETWSLEAMMSIDNNYNRLAESFISSDKRCGGKLSLEKKETLYSIQLKLMTLLEKEKKQISCKQERAPHEYYSFCFKESGCSSILKQIIDEIALLKQVMHGYNNIYNNDVFLDACTIK